MADVLLIRTLTDQPMFNNREWDDSVSKFINEKCKHMNELQILVVKFQIFMLLSVDDEQRNVLHIACRSGSSLIEFIVEQAYSMQILRCMINAVDELGQTPLYMLCMKGHGKKAVDGVYKQHLLRHLYLKLLVKGIQREPKPDIDIASNPNNLA